MISTFQINNIFWTNFTVLLLTTSLVGGIVTVVWLVVGKMLEKIGFLNIVYDLLKMTVFFYCVPLVYGILKVFEFELGRGYLFDTTKSILIFSKVFCVIWILGVIGIMAYVLHTARKLKLKYKKAFTCDIQTQKLFESILHDLKFDETHVRIDLKQSYHAKVPCIVGIIHPIVILPVTTYAQEDLKYILIHEIIHYRQKDILLKWISIILCACHFYNPFAWLLLIQIQKWSEFACDYKVCHYTRTVSKYFEVLINAATNDGIKARLASHFVEHKHELVERAKKMKNAYERKKRSKLCAVFVVGMAFVLSSITVSAVTVGSADNYIKLYQETTVSVKDELVQSEEFIEMDHDSNIIIEIGPVNTLAKSNIAFEWNVGDGYRIRTPLFECRENGYVSVAASIVPNNVRVRIGIGREDGYCKYIISQGSVGHVFNIPSDGDYYFYVENASGTAVTVSGSYVMP